MITIGIDPHERSHTAAALNDHAELRGQIRVSAATAVPTLRCWAARWPQRQWAVEGASGLGRLLAQQLVADGEQVVDVPAKLAARARFLATGNERKNDTVAAVSVADAAIRGGRLRRVTAEGDAVVLRLLADRRDDLNQERTRTLNRLHALLGELVAGGAKRELSATAAAALLGRIRPATPVARVRKRLARDLLADLRRLDRALADNAEQTATAIQASTTSLTEICGIGPVVAALIIGHVGDVARFPSPGHFATYNRTGPDRGVQRGPQAPPPEPPGRPPAQPRPVRRRPVPDPPRHRRARLVPPQARRAQDAGGGSPKPQAAAVQRRVPPPRR